MTPLEIYNLYCYLAATSNQQRWCDYFYEKCVSIVNKNPDYFRDETDFWDGNPPHRAMPNMPLPPAGPSGGADSGGAS